MNQDLVALVILGLVVLFIVGVLIYEAGWFPTMFRSLVLIMFGLAGLASCFSMIASIIHFQILWAMGFFLLMAFLWFIGYVLLEISSSW